MTRRLRGPLRQSGFSIIELMVAIAIGMFLLLGAVTIFSKTRRTYSEQDDMSRIQENARFAMDVILRDLRMAGYFGCSNTMSTVATHLNIGTAGELLDTGRSIEGYENTKAAKWWPSGNATDLVNALNGNNIGDPIAGSDAVTIRHLASVNWQMNAAVNNLTDPVPINDNSAQDRQVLTQNNIVGLWDCSTADIFQITNTPGTGAVPTIIAHVAGTKNTTASLSKHYEGFPAGDAKVTQSARISPLTAVRYYVGRSVTGASPEPALFRQFWDNAQNCVNRDNANPGCTGNPTPLVPGVENMQITYGIDTNNDNIADQYVEAGNALLTTAAQWDAVVSVRIGLLLRSPIANAPETDTQTYTLNGTTLFGGAAPNDKRKRRMVTSTVFLRNHSK